MCNPVSIGAGAMVFSTGLSVYSGISSAYAQRQAAASNKEYYYYLASQMDDDAKTDIRFGMDAMTKVDIASHKVESSQHAAMVANGIGAGSVTAEDILNDTIHSAELDKHIIKLNAQASALNKKKQANLYRFAGNNSMQAGNLNADATLLSTASSVADKWITYGNSKGWFSGSKSSGWSPSLTTERLASNNFNLMSSKLSLY